MPNLPPIIPRASGAPSMPSLPSSGIGRAQQVNISKLNQQKDRDAATTSIAGAIRQKQGGTNTGPTTSIHRTKDNAPASTSVFHPGAAADSMGDESDAVRDRLRFQYIRKMMRQKKMDAAAAAFEAEKNKGMDINTGSSFRTTGVNSIKKTLGRMYRSNRSEFKALSAEDKALFQKVVQDKAQVKRTGSDFTYKDKKQMRQQIFKNYKEGNITKETYKHFKNVIDDIV